MNTKHTPGPWTCHSGMVWKPDGTEDGYPIARMDRETPKTTPTERDANARLIAAAPDLLEALKEVTMLAQRINDIQHAGQTVWPETWSELYRATTDAKAAIANATGGTP